MGLIAICIPTYKKVEFVKRLLDSIRIQTYKNFIVIISDDTEDTSIEEVILNYRDIKMDYYRNNKKLGPTCNTNNAIKLAQKYNPEFIKVMHHDDCFSEPDSLLKMVQVMNRNPDVDLVFCATIERYSNREYIRLLTEQEWKHLNEDFRNIYTFNYIGAPSTTMIRNNGILMDSNLVWYVDIEWYLQLLSNNEKIVHIIEPLIIINHSETQVTNVCVYNPKVWIDEVLYVYKKYNFLHEEKYKDFLIEILEWQWDRLNIIGKYKDKKVYIYGAGIAGQDCAKFLEVNSISFEGFVVSDNQKHQEIVLNHKVYTLSEIINIPSDDIRFILALNKLNKKEVINNLKDCNVEYISYI